MKMRKQVIFYYFFSNACMPQIMTHTPSILHFDEFFASIISLLQRILHLVYSIGKKYKAI